MSKSIPISKLHNLRPQTRVWSGQSTARDNDRLDPELEALADWLDSVFHIPGIGIRFGLDAILGLIPGVGDTLSSLASLYILHAATRYGVPRATIMRMAMNVAVDYAVGSIPLVGDVFDVFWKSNKWNVALLRRHVAAGPQERRRATWGDRAFVAAMIAGLLLILAGSVAVTLWLISSLVHLVR